MVFLPIFVPCVPPQPPLPEEDYPTEDYLADDQLHDHEDLHATGTPTFPKEFSLGHVSRTIIPRANLDRSTPAGWNLNVEPNGTWVFTSEHSPEQVHGGRWHMGGQWLLLGDVLMSLLQNHTKRKFRSFHNIHDVSRRNIRATVLVFFGSGINRP